MRESEREGEVFGAASVKLRRRSSNVEARGCLRWCSGLQGVRRCVEWMVILQEAISVSRRWRWANEGGRSRGCWERIGRDGRGPVAR